MFALAKAAVRLPWALSVFGVQQALRALVAPDSEADRSAQEGWYVVSQRAQNGFNADALLFGAFQIGDAAQRALTDLVWNALSLKTLSPGYLQDLSATLAARSSDAMDAIGDGEALRLTYQEVSNNLQVIGFVNQVESLLQIPETGDYSLEKMLETAYSQGDYAAVWLIEGLGRSYAESSMRRGGAVRDLLTSGAAARLPEKCLLMMHAGIGIAFAKSALETITPYSADVEFDAVLTQFLSRVKENSRQGYAGPALESLGLVTRTWNQPMVAPVASHLARIDPTAEEYFWHGAGRALYFAPLNFIPGFSPWRGARSEPSGEAARRNAFAGVAWAFTLVNIRQPQIMANFLARHARQDFADGAFANGVNSTLVMASEMAPADVYVSGLCRYRPEAAAADAWNSQIGSDCLARVEQRRKDLKAVHRLGEIFRYQPPPVVELSGAWESPGYRA